MGRVLEEDLDFSHAHDTLDDVPLKDGERVRVRWPDGSTTDETVVLHDIVRDEIDFGEGRVAPAQVRRLWLLRPLLRGLQVTVRPALSPELDVERVAEVMP